MYKSATPMKFNRNTKARLKKNKNIIFKSIFSISSPFGGDRGGQKKTMAAKTDNFQSPDYFNVDELLTDEHKLIRESVRNYVKKEISPIIEDYAQRAEFPQQIIKQLGDLGCFGPTVPEQYGGGGLD